MSADHEIFISHPWTEVLSLACMHETPAFLWIFEAFSLILMSDEMTRVTRASILFCRFMGNSVIVQVKGSMKAVHTQKRKLLKRNNDNFKRERLRDCKCERCRDKINQTGLLLKKKNKQRKGSEAQLYYILICLPYSAGEQKSTET